MNKGLKIAIGVLTIGIIGTATYFIYQKIKDSRDTEDGDEKPPIDPPTNVVGNENSNQKTPFTNKAQGDLFRQFVNRFYPSYAREIDLDLTGATDNSFMRRAWGKYGEAYKTYNPSFEKASGTAIPKVLLDAYALRKDKGSFSNNSEGAIFLQTKELGKIDNEKVVAYFYSNGKVSFRQEDKRIRFVKWWNNGKSINADNKNYSGTDFFNTAFKVFEGLKSNSSFIGNGNLQGDLETPARKGIDLDLNIID
jgi:hypothetical protein